MQRYKIRFFFEHGGDCFWGGDEATVEKYGYPIDPADLPIPRELAERCSGMAERWWIAADKENGLVFNEDVAGLLEQVRAALGDGFEVVEG